MYIYAMQYQIVFLDIDGTLLNSKYKVSKETRKVIHHLQNKLNVPIVLATGRSATGARVVHQDLQLNTPFICLNGALIVASAPPLAYWSNPKVPLHLVRPIYDLAQRFDLSLSFDEDEDWFVLKKDNWIRAEERAMQQKAQVIDFETLMTQWQRNASGPSKILFLASPARLNLLVPILRSQFGTECNIVQSSSIYLSVMNKNASKSTAARIVHQKYGIPRSAVLAVGDNFNDVDLLQYAGLGVAMGNAPQSVKAVADRVTTTNDKEGVSQILKEYFL